MKFDTCPLQSITRSDRDDSVTRRVELPKETAPESITETKDGATPEQEPMKPVLPAVVVEEAASSRGLSQMSPMFETFSKVCRLVASYEN